MCLSPGSGNHIWLGTQRHSVQFFQHQSGRSFEAVTGLTTEHFLLALDRFTGRRGLVQHLYSDNGTNFVADYVMKTVYGQLQADYE